MDIGGVEMTCDETVIGAKSLSGHGAPRRERDLHVRVVAHEHRWPLATAEGTEVLWNASDVDADRYRIGLLAPRPQTKKHRNNYSHKHKTADYRNQGRPSGLKTGGVVGTHFKTGGVAGTGLKAGCVVGTGLTV